MKQRSKHNIIELGQIELVPSTPYGDAARYFSIEEQKNTRSLHSEHNRTGNFSAEDSGPRLKRSNSEERIYQLMTILRNKECLDAQVVNKQVKSNTYRAEDAYLNNREIEEFEAAYSDLGVGEIIMTFPNPDAEGVVAKQITITQAMKLFDKNLKGTNSTSSPHELEQLRKAFQLSCMLLDEFISPKNEVAMEQKQKSDNAFAKKQQQDEQSKLNMTEQKLLGRNNNNNASMLNDSLNTSKKPDGDMSMMMGGQYLSHNGNIQKPPQNYNTQHNRVVIGDANHLQRKKGISDLEIGDLVREIRYLEASEKPIVGNQEGDTFKASNADAIVMVKLQNKLKVNGKGGAQGNLVAPQMSKVEKAITKLIKGTMNNDLGSFGKLAKKMNKGEFMFKRNYDEKDYDWVITNHVPKDFQTLLRNCVVLKLALYSKLTTRNHLSRDAQTIVTSVKASEELVASTAAYCRLLKQVELGYADVLSLEPCDEKFRPLRLKYVLRLAVKKCKKDRITGLDEETLAQKRGVCPLKNLMRYKSYGEDEFWINLGRKQLYYDSVLAVIADQIKINQDSEVVEIIDDNDPLNQSIWSAYSLYLDYMIYYTRKMLSLKKFAEQETTAKQPKIEVEIDKNEKKKAKKIKVTKVNPFSKNAALLFRLIMQQSLQDANQYYLRSQSIFKRSQKLQNMWNRLEIDRPISPYARFSTPAKEEHLLLWRTYQINELSKRSIFSNMERIKVCHMIISQQVNTLRLVQEKNIVDYFPIHEMFQLKGQERFHLFQKHFEGDYMKQSELTDAEEKVRKTFLILETEAEASDFQKFSTVDLASIKYLTPWSLPIDAIRAYFGEKIALYFKFLSFMTFHLSYMGVLGLIAEISIQTSEARGYKSSTTATFRFIFAIVVLVWQVNFIQRWKQHQAIFALDFGQEGYSQEEQERPTFQGTYQRSMVNDKMNYKYYSEFKRKFFMLVSLILSVIVVGIVVTIIVALFTLKSYMLENSILIGKFLVNPNTLTGILNSVQIIVFNAVYMKMNDWLSSFENHQIVETYENSYISKVFLFTFCNTFNSCFFIAFFNSPMQNAIGVSYLNFCRISDTDNSDDCFGVLRTQMISIFVLNLVKNIPELIVPLLKIIAKKTKRSAGNTLLMHPFRRIDIHLNDQLDLEPYATNQEIDGTVSDYSEIILQFSFLCIFGLAFPLSFLLAFVNNVIEIQVDKIKLIYISRRPLPVGASNIGTWFVILQIISFLSIFSNAALISFTSNAISSYNDYSADESFLFFLFLKQTLSLLITDIPEKVKIIKKRHFYCLNTLLNGISTTKAKGYISSTPSTRIDGVSYGNKTPFSDNGTMHYLIEDVEMQIRTRQQMSMIEKLAYNSQHFEFMKNEKRKRNQVQVPKLIKLN